MAKKSQIKLPTARRLPSGNWTVQLRLGGESISITKPTEKEAIAEAMAVKQGIVKLRKTPKCAMTLTAAIEDYISQRENVLSPATIAGYKVIKRNRFKALHHTKLCDIDSAKWQKAVNLEANDVSAKTLKNSAMFIQSIIAEYTGVRLNARLPQVVPNDLPWLSPEQIPVFLKAIRGNKYEIPALLALSSLRQSEIVATKWRDIDLENETITVHGSAVKSDDGTVIYKEANKNLSSRRIIYFLLPQLREAAAAQAGSPDDYIYPHYSNVLRLNINKVCRANGLPSVGVHGLRRSFASLAYHLGISEGVTMLCGGWSDFRTMRKTYTKISQADIRSQTKKISDFCATDIQNANESANANPQTVVYQQK